MTTILFRGSAEDFYKDGAYKTFKPLLFRVIGFVLKRADVVIAHTESLKSMYIHYYGVPENRIVVMSNAVYIRGGGTEAARSHNKSPPILTKNFFRNIKAITAAGSPAAVASSAYITLAFSPSKKSLKE